MNIRRTLEHARLSRSVYSWDMWKNYIDDNYFSYRCKGIEIKNHQAGILLHKGVMTIVIRGTDDVNDVLTDINIIPKKFPHLKGECVHSGFLDAAKAIWREMEPWFSDDGITYDNEHINTIIIVGHSLGGAVATLLASIIEFEYERPIQLCTFGSPRVLSDAAAEIFNERNIECCRFVNNNDIVPKLPINGFVWEHVGELYYINRKGTIIQKSKLNFWAKLWDNIASRLSSLLRLKLDGIHDHLIESYIDKLKKGVNNPN